MKRLRYGVYSLWLVLSLVTSLVVPSGVASATNDYGVQLASVLRLGGSGVPQSCRGDGTDMALDWGQIMQAASTGATYSFQNTWNYTSNYNYGREKLDSFVARFQDSVDSESGTGWAVSQVSEFEIYNTQQSEFRSFHKMIRIWAFDPDTTFVLQEGGLRSNKTVYFTDYFLNPNANCRWQAWNYQEVGTTWMGFLYNKFLFVNAQSIAYPLDYSGGLIPLEYISPPAKAVVMGDSIASGEGNPSFERGTDVGGQNGCHRSPFSYARLLQNDSDLNFESMAFVACSGAATANILGGQWNEPSQLDALSDETELVTLNIGANDAGFSDYVLGCVVACGPGTPVYTAMMDGINSPAFKANLVYTYEEILEAAPNADLYVADYPYLADEYTTACQGLDFSGAYEVQTALNEVIFDAVIEVGLNSGRIFMVQTNYPGSLFEGGHLCNGGDSLFYGVIPDPWNYEYSLHPDEGGHGAFAEVFEEAIA
jgi:lysophospholipase L1-like esterase